MIATKTCCAWFQLGGCRSKKIREFPLKPIILPPQKLISSFLKNRYDETSKTHGNPNPMDIKLLLLALTGVFTVACLFFGTQNGFYDSDDYHGNGSAH
ncbi:hypothetical protein FLX56_05225 [Synechococcus moorigangaii CMS01]|nr:hypothetical protein [Synechococcus moorigangaii CMS01]